MDNKAHASGAFQGLSDVDFKARPEARKCSACGVECAGTTNVLSERYLGRNKKTKGMLV